MFRILSKRILPALTLAALCAAVIAIASAENIDPQNDNSQFAWGENVGWINAEPSATGNPGMQVSGTKITGYMYGENIGWINLHCENNATCGTAQYGVTNDNLGNLGGYAWGENAGWISFCDQNTPGTCNVGGASTYRVTIDPNTGIFSGYAWGENIGWISFSDTTPVAYKVQFTDGDAVGGATDNCDFDANPAQTNTDAAPIPLSGSPNDNTIANSDIFGDTCDLDDDNDTIVDTAEAAGCNASGALQSLLADTDGDRVRDAAECALGTNPNNFSSKPPAFPPGDSDGDGLTSAFEGIIGSNPNDNDSDDDGILDGFEYKGYSTSPTTVNTDGDNCDDNVEVASVDTNTVVNSNDLLIVALNFTLTDRFNPDIDKNGTVNSNDLLIVALNFLESCVIP